MKKIIILILICCLGKDLIGQPPIKRAGPANTVEDYNLWAIRSFRPPVFADTTEANNAITLDSCGKLLYTYDVNGLWIRQCSPKKWVRVGSGGSTGGSGIVSLGTTGNLCLTRINDSTYKVDTACLAALFLRRADSTGYYVTPTRLQDTATVLRSLIGAKRDSSRQHYIGPIINQTNWPSLTGYTVNGANAAASGGKIVFSEATSDCFQTVDYDYVTAGDYWSIGGKVTLLKSTGIFAFGIRPLNDIGMNVMARVLPATGYVDFLGNCGNTISRCDSNISMSVGQQVEIILQRQGANFKLIARNITTGAGPYIVDFTYNTNIDILPSTGKPAIFAFGDGTTDPQFQVDSFYFVNQVIKNASFGAKTDSKYAPVRADYNTSAFNLLSGNNTMALFTNPNDKMYEFKQGVTEILNAHPKQLLVSISCNDVRTGRSVHDIMVDMDSVYNVLTAAGIDVIVANGTREAVLDLAPLKDSINAHYGSNVLNTWDVSFARGFLASDSIHISNYGQYLLNNLIKNSGLFNFPDYQLRDVSDRYIFNSRTVPQNAAYNITGASTLSSSLIVGNPTVSIPLTVIHATGQQQLFGSGGYNYTRGLNAAGSAWIPEKRVFTNYMLNTNVASSEYEGLFISRDVNRFGGALVVGNQYDLSNTDAFNINPGNSSAVAFQNNGGTNYWNYTNGGTSGTPLNIRASTYSFNNYNSGSVTNLLTLASTGAAKLSQYGAGTFTGTPAYSLQVDASGNIIEGSAAGSTNIYNSDGALPPAITRDVDGNNSSIDWRDFDAYSISGNTVSATATLEVGLSSAAVVGGKNAQVLVQPGKLQLIGSGVVSTGRVSQVLLDSSKIQLQPSLGGLTIDSLLQSVVTTNKRVVWDSLTGNIATQTMAGIYTPTLTNVANVGASTAYSCQYSISGAVVTVSGEVDIDPTTTLTLTQLGISLPIASNLTATNELGGTSADDLGTIARVAGDATNNLAEVRMTPVDVTNRRFSFTFTYRVL